jgi:hypothetical protein
MSGSNDGAEHNAYTATITNYRNKQKHVYCHQINQDKVQMEITLTQTYGTIHTAT